MSIRRERRDAVENRQLILQTAHELFNEHGVQPVSMHQIAKTAGIGQATLYRRYAHKGDLCLDILDDYSLQLMEQIRDYLENNKQTSAIERLGGIIDFWIDAIEEKSGLISGLMMAMESKMNCNDERGNFFQTPFYLFFRNSLSGLLNEIIEADSGAPLDTEVAAHFFMCAMSPLGYFHIKHEKGYNADQVKEHLRKLCRTIVAKK
ncbi:TetR/AcrR family transcriptional regulator [Cohnella herbarum]|uniref:TetR/AcrR family transcriptional regulator n=1 Tax=Cohnella herbarum TaxID=2728023 RepID=A0A7Z2VPN0_9BACL|nr:TetR/AcrR family transcriptional regulator [Cohnella herbarum]QJD86670.1 TetR/AcrR family transcriptional regulator [Cohnella herbarum]